MPNSAEINNGNSELHFEVTQEDVLKHYNEILIFVNRRMTGVNSHTDAKDITQEVFIKAVNSLHTLRRGEDLKSWLYRIADNEIKEFFRARIAKKRGENITESLDNLSDHSKSLGANPESDYIEGLDNRKFVQNLLKKLSPEQRELLVSKDLNDASIEELAEKSGENKDTIKSKLHRIRENLKKRFRKKFN